MTQNKRQHPRVEKKIVLPVHKKKRMVLQGPKAAGAVAMWMKGPKSVAEIMDISKGGVRIQANVELREGDPLCLVMQSGPHGSMKEIDGTVVWVKPAAAGSGAKIEAGIQFAGLSQAESILLDRLIAGS